MRQIYSIETVVEGVGLLDAEEEHNIRQTLGAGAVVYLNPITHQLHIAWTLEADTMDEALDAARAMHHGAKEATGVYVPRTSKFLVLEVADY